MAENYHYYQQQQQQQQQIQEKAVRPSRLGLRSTGGGGGLGQIVEVQGGHIVRSTGRKDRHSKVCTAKGPRDRRVRLSAHTAIQFYDVQDRLGYDRPSKAVDWLIKKAKASIDELAELPAWKPTADSVSFEQNPNNENLNNRGLGCLEELHDDEIADNQLGNTQNSSFLLLPTCLDSNSVSDTMKSFFPMGASSAPPPQFHHNFPSSDMPLRSTSQNQDLNLSLQSLQGPILQQQQPPPQSEQGNSNNNMFFDNSGWPENGGFQRLVAWGGGGSGGDAVPSGFAFNSPPFLQPLFGQTTNNQLLNYISQRGPLQSSNTPPVRAWVDTPPFNGVAVDPHQALAFNHPVSMPGYTSGGFSGFHIPARIQGDEEEHDGISDKPSSASSDSRH